MPVLHMPVLQFRLPAFAFAVAAVIATPVLAETKDPWPDLARDVFDNRPLVDGAGMVSIEMPARADDAALVPVSLKVKLPAGDARTVKAVTLIIDENPAPVAATFTIGGNATTAAIATRVRVNAYTNVHAVAELSDGALHMVKTYVKASGGCSAPAAKVADEGRRGLGQMRFRQFALHDAAPVGGMREAQIMIRHPNNSGLQMDQVTRLYTPAHFVQTIKVWQGDELVLAMEGGISLSEDPNIRFSYIPNGATTFRVEARDTENLVFKGEWPVDASAM
jgi:sulfur-oxidizing protein SoxY